MCTYISVKTFINIEMIQSTDGNIVVIAVLTWAYKRSAYTLLALSVFQI